MSIKILQLLQILIEKVRVELAVLQIKFEVALLRLKKKSKKNYYAFCLVIKQQESSNNYRIVNSLGYMGAYQFGMARLCDLGYTERILGTRGFSNKVFRWKKGYSQEMFLNNPNWQDKIFR